MAQGLEVLIKGVENLSNKMDDIEDSVGDANKALGSMTASLKSNEVSTSDLEDETEDLAAAFVKTVPAAKAADSAIDEAGDSAMNSAAQMGFLESVMDKASFSAGALSINVGAFTVALRQLHTQIPLIVTALGTLASGLGAVGSAAVGAGGALGGIFAGGFIGLIEQTEQQFANITTTGEATEKVLRAIGQMFRQALEPLVNQENINLFIQGLESTAAMANQAAQAVEMVKDDVLQLFSAVTDAGNLDRLLGALQNTLIVTEVGGKFESTGEVLARFLAFVAEKLPTAIDFMNNTLVNLAPSLKQIGQSFLNLTIQLVEFAEGAGPAFVDVISMILDSFTALFTAINNLNDSLKGAALEVFLLTAVTLRLASAFDTFMGIGFKFLDLMGKTAFAAGGLAGKLGGIMATSQSFMRGHAAGVGLLMSSIISCIPVLNKFQDQIDELSGDGDNEFLENDELRAKRFENRLNNIIPTLDDVKKKISSIGPSLPEPNEMVKFMDEFERAPEMKGVNFREPDTGHPVSPDREPIQPTNIIGGLKSAPGKIKSKIKSISDRARSSGKTIAKSIGTIATAGFKTLAFEGIGRTLRIFGDFTSELKKARENGKLVTEAFDNLGLKVIPNLISSLYKSIVALLGQAAAFIKSQLSAIAYQFSVNGVTGALKQVARFIYSSIVALLAQAKAFLISSGAATILQGVLFPLTGILLAISVAMALVVGAIGNLNTSTGKLASSLEGPKNTAIALGEALLGYLVPLFNVLLDVFEAVAAIGMGLVDGIILITQSVMEAAGAGSSASEQMKAFGNAMDVLGGIVSALGPVFDMIATVIHGFIMLVAEAIALILGGLVGALVKAASMFINFAKSIGAIESIKGFIKGVSNAIEGFISGTVNQLNGLINALNQIFGTNIQKIGKGDRGGNMGSKFDMFKTSETQVKENIRSETEKDSAKSEQAGTRPPYINYENNVQNTANVDAESDEKEDRIKTLVERALSDADTFRRNQVGQ